jgi:hypothetical protein
MDFTTIPNDFNEIIQWLDAQYPDRCPKLEMSEREIWIAVGERKVVEVLIAKLAAGQEQDLKGE